MQGTCESTFFTPHLWSLASKNSPIEPFLTIFSSPENPSVLQSHAFVYAVLVVGMLPHPPALYLNGI